MQQADGTIQEIRDAIQKVIPGADVLVTAGTPGHYEIDVVSDAFEGKSLLNKQRLVYGAIAHLMKIDNAPVHAIDRLRTLLPSDER